MKNINVPIFKPNDKIVYLKDGIQHTVKNVIVRGFDLIINTLEEKHFNSEEVRKL